MLPLLLLLQTVPAAAPAAGDSGARFNQCMDLATTNPAAGVTSANAWRVEGGGPLARQCLGVAFANQKQWPSAAAAFEDAARSLEAAHDPRAANNWAQAGNAWLAAGQLPKARTALDAALASGTLGGLELGEAYLDRARVLVANGDAAGARADLDHALTTAEGDPLAWLLSATLARRQGDLPRARKDIAEALRLSADDASVQLEAGNIAASASDEAGARAAWTRATQLAPGTPVAAAAAKALQQFGADAR